MLTRRRHKHLDLFNATQSQFARSERINRDKINVKSLFMQTFKSFKHLSWR